MRTATSSAPARTNLTSPQSPRLLRASPPTPRWTARKVKGAPLIAIVASTIPAVMLEAIADLGAANPKTNPNGWQLNVPSFDGKHFGWPNLDLVGNFSLGGGFSAIGIMSGIVIVFSLVLSDFFDVMGTTIGLASEANLLE